MVETRDSAQHRSVINQEAQQTRPWEGVVLGLDRHGGCGHAMSSRWMGAVVAGVGFGAVVSLVNFASSPSPPSART